ncbi:hypothetical protein JMUB590_1543 [Staphylococcus caprae]|uniref:Uncharacterized protein n=1 Tax=Staphylococcus caprae TaxID=29380 RepID=A0ABN5W3Y5_9STAP|nr:hypothetical protein JMUB145_1543 [Staphylococcus caprae]BBD92601.1 hypothetical protein JMUB590_1543 [Staphylococcus caprae]BBD95106.1 hypothetical protein JMUB898_1537 [Staphylococcus caprae]
MNAAPITTATAKSNTLPLRANSLNSFNICIVPFYVKCKTNYTTYNKFSKYYIYANLIMKKTFDILVEVY